MFLTKPTKKQTIFTRTTSQTDDNKNEIEDNPKLQVSDIEFSMPQPSYTIDTLIRLKERHPKINTRLSWDQIIYKIFTNGKIISKF